MSRIALLAKTMGGERERPMIVGSRFEWFNYHDKFAKRKENKRPRLPS